MEDDGTWEYNENVLEPFGSIWALKCLKHGAHLSSDFL